MHSCTKNNDVSLSKEFQKNLSKEHEKHGVIDQGEYRKRASIRKWTHREYHVQYNTDVAHKDVRMYCYTNQFPELPFCAPHTNPRGARGLSKHYHLLFDPKNRSWHMCDFPHTMCVCCMYINYLQTLDFC